jgi:hypothetical protein
MSAVAASGFTFLTEKLLHQVGDLFELNVKLQCKKVKYSSLRFVFKGLKR